MIITQLWATLITHNAFDEMIPQGCMIERGQTRGVVHVLSTTTTNLCLLTAAGMQVQSCPPLTANVQHCSLTQKAGYSYGGGT